MPRETRNARSEATGNGGSGPSVGSTRKGVFRKEGEYWIALQQAESLANVLERAEIRRFHAVMPLDCAAPDDLEKARTLLREALETYTQIGMPCHIERVQELLN